MWKHEKKIKDWMGRDIVIGIYLDGDIGILDHKGYSIIIGRDQSEELSEWLTRHFCNNPVKT